MDREAYGRKWAKCICWTFDLKFEARKETQKKPFDVDQMTSGLYGPLMPFDFLSKKGEGQFGVVTLHDLKSLDFLKRAAARASLEPDRNRSWSNHPCIAVKISGGNNRWDSNASVDFLAYFATDLDLYPVAYEVYKNGKLAQSFTVVTFTSILLNDDAKHVFRYPELAKGISYNSDNFHTSAPSGFWAYDLDAKSFNPNVKINTLSGDDFKLDPGHASYIEDRDLQKLIPVPR